MKKNNFSVKKIFGLEIKGNCKALRFQSLVFLAVFCCISHAYGADVQRAPISVNLIIDGSFALASVKEEITAWVSNHLDQILAEGDTVTIWNAGAAAAVVYTTRINSNSDREAVMRSIGDLSAAGETTDFSGALTAVDTQEKTAQQGREQTSSFSYTILISASQTALISLLSGPQANLLRFSRVEEFSGWRAVVVGLNLDTQVKRAASNFINTQ